jgi:hypothetical protein
MADKLVKNKDGYLLSKFPVELRDGHYFVTYSTWTGRNKNTFLAISPSDYKYIMNQLVEYTEWTDQQGNKWEDAGFAYVGFVGSKYGITLRVTLNKERFPDLQPFYVVSDVRVPNFYSVEKPVVESPKKKAMPPKKVSKKPATPKEAIQTQIPIQDRPITYIEDRPYIEITPRTKRSPKHVLVVSPNDYGFIINKQLTHEEFRKLNIPERKHTQGALISSGFYSTKLVNLKFILETNEIISANFVRDDVWFLPNITSYKDRFYDMILVSPRVQDIYSIDDIEPVVESPKKKASSPKKKRESKKPLTPKPPTPKQKLDFLPISPLPELPYEPQLNPVVIPQTKLGALKKRKMSTPRKVMLEDVPIFEPYDIMANYDEMSEPEPEPIVKPKPKSKSKPKKPKVVEPKQPAPMPYNREIKRLLKKLERLHNEIGKKIERYDKLKTAKAKQKSHDAIGKRFTELKNVYGILIEYGITPENEVLMDFIGSEIKKFKNL